MSRATVELWWLALSALAFGLTALGPLAASASAADPYIGGLLVFYAAMHAVPVALALLAVATRRVQWVGSAAASARGPAGVVDRGLHVRPGADVRRC